MAMEVEVLGVTGAPDGAILSVRAGGQRRQAAATSIGQSKTPFRFSTGPNGLNPFRVDLLKPVGSAKLALKPGEGNYTTTLKPAHPAAREVQVKFAVCEAGKAPAINEPADADADGAEAPAVGSSSPPLPVKEDAFPPAAAVAKEYLEQHKLLPFVRSLLQTVIREQPDDPFNYIEEQFRNASSAASAARGGSEIMADSSSAPPPPPKELPFASTNLSEVAKSAPPPVRQLGGEKLLSPKVPPREVRVHGQPRAVWSCKFEHKPSVGSWMMRRQRPIYQRPNVQPKFLRGQAAIDTMLGVVEMQPSPPRSPVGLGLNAAELRHRAQEALLSASVDGSFDKALGGGSIPAASTKALGPSRYVAAAPAPPVADPAEVRRRAQEVLLNATLDGSLERTLGEDDEDRSLERRGEEDIDALRAKAAKETLPPAELRRRAQEAVLKAAFDGSLKRSLDEENADAAKAKAKHALLGAMLDEMVPSSDAADELNELKARAQAAIESTLLEDTDDSAVEEAKQKAKLALEEALLADAHLTEEEVEAARERAAEALHVALFADEELTPEEIEDAKQKAAKALEDVLEPDESDGDALEEAKDEARRALRAAVLGKPATPEHPPPFQMPAEEGLKAKAVSALESALDDICIDDDDENLESAKAKAQAALEKVMEQQGETPSEDSGVPARDADTVDEDEHLEIAKSKAQAALQSMLNGGDESPGQVTMSMRELAEAGASGRLAARLPRAERPPVIEPRHDLEVHDELEAAKEKAQAALEQVLDSGGESPSQENSELEAVKAKAQVALEQALDCDEDAPAQDNDEIEAVKAKAQAALEQVLDSEAVDLSQEASLLRTLADASVSGKLAAALTPKHTPLEEQDLEAKAASAVDYGVDDTSDELEVVEAKAQSALEHALEDKEDFLNQDDDLSPEELEAARMRAKGALRKALVDESESIGVHLTDENLAAAEEKANAAVDTVLLAEQGVENDLSADEREQLKFKAQQALQAALDEGYGDGEEIVAEELDILREKAQEALETAVLSEAQAVLGDTDITEEQIESAKNKAQEALTYALLAEATAEGQELSQKDLEEARCQASESLDKELLQNEDGVISDADVKRLKAKAQSALRQSLMSDASQEDANAAQMAAAEPTSSSELELAEQVKAQLCEQRDQLAKANVALKAELERIQESYRELQQARDQQKQSSE